MRKIFNGLVNLTKQKDSTLFNKDIFQIVISEQTYDILWANFSALNYLKTHPKNNATNLLEIPILGEKLKETIKNKNSILTYELDHQNYVAVMYYSKDYEESNYILIAIEKKDIEDKMAYLKDKYKADKELLILLDEKGDPLYFSENYLENFNKEDWDQSYQAKEGVLEHITLCYAALTKEDSFRILKRNKDKNIVLLHKDIYPLYSDNKIIGYAILYSFESEDIFKYSDGQTFRNIIDNIVDGVLIASKDLITLWVNKAMQKLTGYDSEELVGSKVGKVKSGVHDKVFYDQMWKKINSGKSWEGVIWDKKKTGEVFPSWLQIIPFKDGTETTTHYVAIYKDLSDYDSPNKKLLLALEKDPLTNIYNKTYFIEKATRIIEDKEKSGTILFIDIDNFKNINDRHGHIIGDKLLLEVAKLLTGLYPKGILARYGGDEFIIYQPKEDSNDNPIEKVSTLMDHNIKIDGTDYKLALSVGYAHHNKGNKSLIELVKEADDSMYQIKNDKKMIKHSDL